MRMAHGRTAVLVFLLAAGLGPMIGALFFAMFLGVTQVFEAPFSPGAFLNVVSTPIAAIVSAPLIYLMVGPVAVVAGLWAGLKVLFTGRLGYIDVIFIAAVTTLVAVPLWMTGFGQAPPLSDFLRYQWPTPLIFSAVSVVTAVFMRWAIGRFGLLAPRAFAGNDAA
ncbi:MAG: hypothetical protein AAF732_18240 [Pseudomonadota bacterium]